MGTSWQKMYGCQFIRTVVCLVFALSCSFSAVAPARGPSVGVGSSSLQELLWEFALKPPNDSAARNYLPSLENSKEMQKMSGLPLEEQLEMLGRRFSSGLASNLMSARVDDILSAGAEGSGEKVRGQEVEGMARGRSLSKLIDRICSGSSWKTERDMDACLRALVADKRLGTAAWEEYAHVTMKDIADGTVSRDVATDRLGRVVMTAARVGALEEIKVIVSKAVLNDIKVDLAANANYAIRWASYNGHFEVVKFLLEMKIAHSELFGGIDPAAANNDALLEASFYGHFEVIKVLLEMKKAHPVLFGNIDPAVADNYAINEASAGGHFEVIRVLLTTKIADPVLFERIDPAACDNYAIRDASQSGHVEIVRFLLEMRVEYPELFGGIDPAADSNYAIRWASMGGHFGVVKVLLEMKIANPVLLGRIDPAARDNYAIVWAIAYGHIEVVKVLLEMKEGDTDNKFGYQNIDPAAENSAGPKRASEHRHFGMIEFLREKKEMRPDLYGGLVLDW